MNWDKIWLAAVAIWIILIIFCFILFYFFHYCNCSCYWTNEIAEVISLPIFTLFVFWTFGLVPLGIITLIIEERKEIKDMS